MSLWNNTPGMSRRLVFDRGPLYSARDEGGQNLKQSEWGCGWKGDLAPLAPPQKLTSLWLSLQQAALAVHLIEAGSPHTKAVRSAGLDQGLLWQLQIGQQSSRKLVLGKLS